MCRINQSFESNSIAHYAHSCPHSLRINRNITIMKKKIVSEVFVASSTTTFKNELLRVRKITNRKSPLIKQYPVWGWLYCV